MAIRADRVGVRQDQVDVHGRVTSPSFLNELLESLPEWTDMPVWVNGTEELSPSNNSVPVTSPILADIAYPDIRRDNQYFTYRESPTPVDGLAKIRSIKGNTLVWNQLVDASQSSGSSNGITFTNNNDGSWSVSGTATASAQRRVSQFITPIKNNHKYFVKGCMPGGGNNYQLRVFKNSGETHVGSDIGSGFLFTADDTFTNIALYFIVSNGYSVNGKIYPQIFDLTQMGLDITDPSEFTFLFPLPYYAYNIGTLLSFNGTGIKTANADETEEHATNLPIATYFPTGMKNAGNVYDELTPTKATTRIGAVDLGSLSWYYTSGGQGRFASGGIASTVKPVASNSKIANIKCVKYSTVSAGAAYSGNVGIAIDNNGSIWVYDTTYGTDASAFKTAMNGVYLYYELATPVELPTMSFE